MYENGWNRFVKTGQVLDYLSYKGYPTTKNKTGNSHRRLPVAIFAHRSVHADGGTQSTSVTMTIP